MTEILTAAQMRAVEKAAIESGDVTGLQLMERAGEGVIRAILSEWPEFSAKPGRALVLCGPGNNGGDGFVIARLLHAAGWRVEAHLYGNPAHLPEDARVNHDRWAAMGEVKAWNDAALRRRGEADPDHDLVIDALFGIGLSRALPDDLEETLNGLMPDPLSDRVHAPAVPRFVAVDIPSGMDADSGKAAGCMPVHLCVTFHRPKIGHFMVEAVGKHGGAIGCYKLVVVDLGLQHAPSGQEVQLLTGPLGGAGVLGKRLDQHKFSNGHALVLSGGAGRGGAARLSARAALRIGAGLVTLACPPEALAENAARLDAVMLRPLEDAAALEEALTDRRITALCLGPGLGLDQHSRDLVACALKGGRPTVLDADALTLIAGNAELASALHDGCVLTPHSGEFARLFPDIAARLAAPFRSGPAFSKVDACREAAARAGCVVLFKGPDTVIAAPDGGCAVNASVHGREAPWLATAGSGDVLAGIVTGLLARRASPFEAACNGAWLHVEAARSFGPGLIAEDLPEELPKVLRGLGL